MRALARTHTHAPALSYSHTHTEVCSHPHSLTHTHACAHTCTHTRAHTCTCTFALTHTRTYALTHTHTHTCTHSLPNTCTRVHTPTLTCSTHMQTCTPSHAHALPTHTHNLTQHSHTRTHTRTRTCAGSHTRTHPGAWPLLRGPLLRKAPGTSPALPPPSAPHLGHVCATRPHCPLPNGVSVPHIGLRAPRQRPCSAAPEREPDKSLVGEAAAEAGRTPPGCTA